MIIKLQEINKKILTKLIKTIFIYPTDTIYGLGCDATNIRLVNKIREIKQRDNKPFSLIAPSFAWIKQNLIIDVDLDKYLPGLYTLILKKKNPLFLSHVSNTKYLGIRIPNHPFTKLLQKTGKPIITTSVNLAGQPSANSISDSKEILDKVGFVIDAGKLSGKPSTLIKQGEVIER